MRDKIQPQKWLMVLLCLDDADDYSFHVSRRFGVLEGGKKGLGERGGYGP